MDPSASPAISSAKLPTTVEWWAYWLPKTEARQRDTRAPQHDSPIRQTCSCREWVLTPYKVGEGKPGRGRGDSQKARPCRSDTLFFRDLVKLEDDFYLSLKVYVCDFFSLALLESPCIAASWDVQPPQFLFWYKPPEKICVSRIWKFLVDSSEVWDFFVVTFIWQNPYPPRRS